jgi:hypothetical protein
MFQLDLYYGYNLWYQNILIEYVKVCHIVYHTVENIKKS